MTSSTPPAAVEIVGAELNGGTPHVVAEPRDAQSPPVAVRNRLPDERVSLTHKFSVGGHEGYITVGKYPDGQPGEIFITMAKAGSTIAGLMNCFALAISVALQHGVPLKLLCEKFSHARFEPCGWTPNPDIGFAKSLMDYLFRWLDLRFIESRNASKLPSATPLLQGTGKPNGNNGAQVSQDLTDMGDAPSCPICGAITCRSGTCYRCLNCGSTTGCG